jgi:UDP:flavonoid glycosyltransferase YjiC (YdhE family)
MSMRILFCANPMFGHVNSLLPLAVAARRAGHAVLVATGPDMVDHVRSHGVRALPVGPTYAESRTRPDEPWLDYFGRVARDRAQQLVPMARSWGPDVVVHEETELAGAVAAAATDARHVVHGLGIPPPARIWEELTSAIIELGRPWGVTDTDRMWTDATYVDVCPPSLQQHQVPWNTVRPVRPTAPPQSRRDQLPAQLAALPHATTAHVTLGTVFNHNADLLREAIHALAQLDVNVVATTGPDSDPGRLGPQPPHVIVRRYVPHGLLLPHCAVVVSQGGAGIMFAALSHGVPQLMLPQGADQYGNADACVAAGAALSLAGADVGSVAISSAAQRLLADPAFAGAAARLRAEIEAMPPVAEVLHVITIGKVCAS